MLLIADETVITKTVFYYIINLTLGEHIFTI